MNSQRTSQGYLNFERLGEYLSCYGEDGAEIEPSGNSGRGLTAPPHITAADDHRSDVDSFVQQKVVELNCRRHRYRQLAVMSDLSDDADKTTLGPTFGAIRDVLHTLQQSAAPRAISLDSLLFEGSVEMDNTGNGADETLGSIFSADESLRTRKQSRYRQIKRSAEELVESSERVLTDFYQNRDKQHNLSEQMKSMLVKSCATMLNISTEKTDRKLPFQPVESAPATPEKPPERTIRGEEDFDAWMKDFKCSRPGDVCSEDTSQERSYSTPPKTPTAPPRFDDDDSTPHAHTKDLESPETSFVTHQINGTANDDMSSRRHGDAALFRNESPTTSSQPVRHGSHRLFPDEIFEFSSVTDTPNKPAILNEVRPPPHPNSKPEWVSRTTYNVKEGGEETRTTLSRRRYLPL